jgi:hypothetical protein
MRRISFVGREVERREARRQPAVPPPTMMKSYVDIARGRTRTRMVIEEERRWRWNSGW